MPPPPEPNGQEKTAEVKLSATPEAKKAPEAKKPETTEVKKPEAKPEKTESKKPEKTEADKGDAELFAGVLFIEDVVSLIREFGEREPNGRRYRVLLRTLRQRADKKVGAGELEKLLLAMAASGLVTLKQGEQLHDGSIVTFVPQN